MAEKLLAVDGNSILNRAFYGIRDLTNSKGMHTNAVYGMITMLTRYLEQVKPDCAAVAFDLRAPTFRHRMYDGYKATRKGMPEELAQQLPYAKRACRALGFHTLELEGYEGDDILGTLARLAEENGCRADIVTGDRDSLQLISDTTNILLATNTDYIRFDRAMFFEKYGIRPEQFVDVKSLMGDSSDNIPGVPGIGEKTALSLITRFTDLERLFAEAEASDLTPSVKKKLSDGKESAFLSRDLAQICRQVPLEISFENLHTDGMDTGEMFELCTELEFSALIRKLHLTQQSCARRIPEEASGGEEGGCAPPFIPVTPEELNAALVPGSRVAVALDAAQKRCLAFCSGNAYETGYSSLAELAFLFTRADLQIVCYDAKEIAVSLLRSGIRFTNCTDDIMLGAYVLDSNSGNYSFERLAMAELQQTFEGSAPDPFSIYRIAERQRKRLTESGQYELYRTVELPFCFVLAGMESAGFKVDRSGLEIYSNGLRKLEEQYTERIYTEAGCEFNINSPKQLGTVLFEALGLPAGKKTKSGYSTNAETLERLSAFSPVVADVLEYRKIAKLRGTYGDGLLKVIGEDGCIHTIFKQTGTATGRISSAEPNLQNIPVRTELGRELRRFFIPKREGAVLIDADYSQIELRLLAHMSEDANMIEAFRSGDDIHTKTASQVFGVPMELVTPELRKRAKAVNFGIVYGIGDFSLAQDLGISKRSAAEYIEGYFAAYPGISAYLKNTVENAKQDGYVTTLLGRRRYIPELQSTNKVVRSFGERVAMNSPIQGTAADIIKIAMNHVADRLREEQVDAHIVLQVHDEIILESARSDADRAAWILKQEMEHAVELAVPLLVEVASGNCWLESKT